jgi:hypothetical protein
MYSLITYLADKYQIGEVVNHLLGGLVVVQVPVHRGEIVSAITGRIGDVNDSHNI